jgi:predicted nucleotidyltransferase
VEKRKTIVSQIQDYVLQYYRTVKLELFGSSYNGFGLLKSDIDICLTFTDSETGKVGFFTVCLCGCILTYLPYVLKYKVKLLSILYFLSKIKELLHVGK